MEKDTRTRLEQLESIDKTLNTLPRRIADVIKEEVLSLKVKL